MKSQRRITQIFLYAVLGGILAVAYYIGKRGRMAREAGNGQRQ